MNRRLFAVFVVFVVIFASLGVTYGAKDGIKIGPVNYNIEFITFSFNDNEAVNYADAYGVISADKKVLDVTFSNAYPGYLVDVTYAIKNTGNTPVAINNIFVFNPHPEAIDVALQNFVPFILDSDQIFERTEEIQILPNAEQDGVYSFQIMINVDEERLCPGSIGYWKHQFSVWLEGKGNPMVDQAVLEDWLDAVSFQSEVFEFVGTQTDKFNQAFDILEPTKSWTTLDHLKAQLLGLWLNFVSGRTIGLTYQQMDAWEIITASEQVIIGNQIANMEQWKNTCESFNNICFP